MLMWESAEIFTSGTTKNLGRLYYCCAKGYNKRYLFKWTDECLMDEVEDTKSRRGDKCMSEVRCLRNVVVCSFGIATLCFYFFS
ncbi:hypothetical protein N665_0239s0011 [Sinapis alba]|nr:hypothetical protein N665_0239s0011 [Sinapis alba]